MIASTNLAGVEPPATLEIAMQARALAAAGKDVISLSMGEPDFPPPGHVREAAAQAARFGDTRYGPVAGQPALRAAIAEKFWRDNGLRYQPDQTIVGTGGKQVLFSAFFATLNPGDEVIVPTPCWVSYPDMVRACGGIPVLAPCTKEQGFLLDPDALEALITPRTRWLVLNSPSNPTGAVYPAERLAEIGAVLERHPDVLVLTDDIYEHFVYDETFSTISAIRPDLRDRTLTMNGVSKAYAMPGWRIGYGAGPRELIRAMEIAQGQMTSGPSALSQAAALAALTGPQAILAERRGIYRTRRDLVLDRLADIDVLDCPTPAGAFYVFPACHRTTGSRSPAGTLITNDSDFAMALLTETGVAVVPGSAFKTQGHFRISYAGADDELTEACRRISEFTAGLTPE